MPASDAHGEEPVAAGLRGWDTHMHLVPPAIVDAVRAGRFGLSVEQQRMQVGRSRAPLGKINDVAALIARLDADRLVGGFVALPPLLFRADQPGAQRRAWAEFVNESL